MDGMEEIARVINIDNIIKINTIPESPKKFLNVFSKKNTLLSFFNSFLSFLFFITCFVINKFCKNFRKFILNDLTIGYGQKSIYSIRINGTRQTIAFGVILLQPISKSLGEVTVTGNGPVVENKIDKIVYHIQ